MENETLQQNKDGSWTPATPEPYYPNIWERLTHFFGKHWYYQARFCVMCGKYKPDFNCRNCKPKDCSCDRA